MPDSTNPTFRPDRYEWLKYQAALDLTDIDEELMRIAVLIQEAGECSALANEIRETAKDDVEQAKAHVAGELREIPYKNKQRSESMIDTEIPLNEGYRNSLRQLSQARMDAALWATVVEALRVKSMQIRTAADLLTSGFITTDYIRDKRRREIREAKVTG